MPLPNLTHLSSHAGPLGLIDAGFGLRLPTPLGLGFASSASDFGAAAAAVTDQIWSRLNHEDSLPRFAPLHDPNGFDDASQPHWQMVPLRGTRDVMLHLPVGGEQFTVTSTRPDIAAVRHGGPGLAPGVVRIEGVRGRSCAIEVHDARGRLRARMEVTVKDALRRTVTFLSLSDRNGPHAHSPFSAGSPVSRLATGVNIIFLPQANIAIQASQVTIRELKIDRRFGRKVSQRELDNHIYPALMDAGVEGTPILFVGDYEDAAVGRSSVNGIFRRHAGTPGAIVLDARPEHIVSTLAHEIGHSLISHSQYRLNGRREDHSHRREDLMYAYNPHGTRLRRDDVTVMNTRGLS